MVFHFPIKFSKNTNRSTMWLIFPRFYLSLSLSFSRSVYHNSGSSSASSVGSLTHSLNNLISHVVAYHLLSPLFSFLVVLSSLSLLLYCSTLRIESERAREPAHPISIPTLIQFKPCKNMIFLSLSNMESHSM